MTEGTEKRGRGRPKGSRNKPKDGAAPKPDKEVTHAIWRPEDLDEEQLRVVFLQNVSAVNRADGLLEKAKEDRKNAINKAQAEYGDKFLEHMKLDERLQRDEGKKLFRETIDGCARIARWNNVPIQTDLFSEDRMPIEDRTFEEGKRAGMAGDSATVPGHLGGPLIQKWLAGWHVGQEIARSKLLGMQTLTASQDLDEGVFDYYSAGVAARKNGEGGTPPDELSPAEADDWLRGWSSAQQDAEAA